jgi:hypothetical protein
MVYVKRYSCLALFCYLRVYGSKEEAGCRKVSFREGCIVMLPGRVVGFALVYCRKSGFGQISLATINQIQQAPGGF